MVNRRWPVVNGTRHWNEITDGLAKNLSPQRIRGTESFGWRVEFVTTGYYPEVAN
jgi:hypothetical protein